MGTAGFSTGAPKAPKGGAKGATPPEGEVNPAEGGSSRVVYNLLLVGCIFFSAKNVNKIKLG